jgi:hypothetical protein
MLMMYPRITRICARLLTGLLLLAGATASGQVTVADDYNVTGNLTVTFYGREAATAFPGRDFAIVVLPDTQNYAREAAGNGDAVKEMWFSQTEWIITNRVSRNIAYVTHLGDILQNGDIKNGSPNNTEWRNATNALYRLENPTRTLLPDGIPYGMAVGNHDQEPIGEPDGTSTHFNQCFGVSHFSNKSYYGGNGYMRLMCFSPTNNTVNIKTYSPWLDQYLTDADSQMSFPYNMQTSTGGSSSGSPYAVLGVLTGVPPGSVVSCLSGVGAKNDV